ncbi:MAG: hypothetical protein COW62_02450 [Zetaproteobacteria bacterium CG17_big_fil_post_rev_8_21_14_2_50_50_13]|nr:MAG: hypothetical protein COW62_02450 [Zetaproteobacteria bacterium CG17_big_fil_post_rev_8_21_14_2_50_50_13]PIY55846.1 MAG: hypothetical protein COZ00_07320 [Zetaproteobacteria bacterium CG_4_10_14_0_8_um_filter_49_80]
MAVAIKLSDELVNDAKLYAKAQHRTPPKQIEHWAKLGKIAEENPDLPFKFIQDVMLSHEEAELGQLEPYQFG